MSFVCDGEIAQVPTSDGKKYVKCVFANEAGGLVLGFQQSVLPGDKCEIEDEKNIVKGTYVTFSKIDKNPIINVEEKIMK